VQIPAGDRLTILGGRGTIITHIERHHDRESSDGHTSVSPEKAEFVTNVIAGAADQYLTSYLVLTRFEECGPYSIAFALAHLYRTVDEGGLLANEKSGSRQPPS
jgi:hypothetical protein